MKKYRHLFLLVLLLLIIAACDMEREKTPAPTPCASPVEVVLQPYHERIRFEIGEYNDPDLIIRNHNEVPIEIQGVVLCRHQLSFANPSALHLIGPDGQDLLLPYRQSAIADPECPAIQVEAQGEYWGSISLSLWRHLRQPGQYTFWVELLDNLGKGHRSNELSFQLVDVPAAVSPELLELTLQPEQTFYTVEELLKMAVRFKAVLTNKSDKPLVFLETPSDVCISQCSNPVCELTVLDSVGRNLMLESLDCDMEKPTYHKFTVEPGSSHLLYEFPLYYYPEMRPGEYRMRLTYIIRENAVKFGVVLDEPMNWEVGMFTGVLESNEITITIRE